jgi:hypothetical protein
MKIDKSKIEKIILLQANEDYTGLYEIIIELNSLIPNSEEKLKIEIASEVLRDYLMNDLIKLYRLKWASDQQKEISIDESIILIYNSESYQLGDSYIGFAATEKGENFFKVNY